MSPGAHTNNDATTSASTDPDRLLDDESNLPPVPVSTGPLRPWPAYLDVWMNGHGDRIRDSAINERVFQARGYSLLHTAGQAHEMGFSNRQSERVCQEWTALLVPLWCVTNETGTALDPSERVPSGYQMRPSRLGPPRVTEDGEERQPPKYETPFGQANILDCNPTQRETILETSLELWVTEGARKVDALASIDVACIGLSGVWNWKGRERPGDKDSPSFPLDAWDAIPLKGRDVNIVFDSDAETNIHVRKAEWELAAYLTARGAHVRICRLPAADDGAKQGVDDFLSAGGTYADLAGALTEPVKQVESDGPTFDRKVELWKTTLTKRRALRKLIARGESVDAPTLFTRIEAAFRKYCVMPDEHCYTAIALWAAHTYLVHCWDVTPRLAILSAEKQSGKTRVLEVLEIIVQAPERTLNISTAALFRVLQEGYGTHEQPTILFDEIDSIFPQRGKVDPAKEDLRGLLNGGYRKGASVMRCETVGKSIVVVKYEVYSAVAMAGIGHLPDTITDRSVIIRMKRRAKEESVSQFRHRWAEEELKPVRSDLVAWSAAVKKKATGLYPDLPEGVEDRAAEVWEALVAIADLVGGDWPQRARAACRHFVFDVAADEKEESRQVRLLRDVKTVWDAHPGSPQLPSQWLVDRLKELPDAGWDDLRFGLTPKWMSSMLGEFGVHPRKVRFLVPDESGTAVSKTLNGYLREDLADAWRRYL